MMRKLGRPIPLDFVDDGPVPAAAQLGVAVSAVSPISAKFSYVDGDVVAASALVKVSGDNTTAGKLELWVAGDILPTAAPTSDFVPTGWVKLSDGVTVSGNGVFTCAPIAVCHPVVQWRWNPSAGTTGQIQGTQTLQGRP